MSIEEKNTEKQKGNEVKENQIGEKAPETEEERKKREEEEKRKKEDEPMLALNIFGFLFFLIGLIIYCAQKKKYPRQMESLKGWLIASFILRVVIAVVGAFIR